ncbi:Glutamyl-tRNA(Gln) amidotransferase subunit B, mitochondrial [Portunus trituberculatus]|uniref:Glutamyl-tRNA(Gln) amidotransferase subunit B, mitochondrial n=1 Tax=Portunus trituberculatus TaxID=210409 RepID=A0A5B7DN81_PORTR|nr:Glutamyl-tRNA(Gln) amidotransferase subunit B, mitochondrial [Portunus trituberculatus]
MEVVTRHARLVWAPRPNVSVWLNLLPLHRTPGPVFVAFLLAPIHLPLSSVVRSDGWPCKVIAAAPRACPPTYLPHAQHAETGTRDTATCLHQPANADVTPSTCLSDVHVLIGQAASVGRPYLLNPDKKLTHAVFFVCYQYRRRVLVDLNRAGQPLMELVFGPQLHSGEEAAAMVKEVALILSKIETCNCRMHEGSLRVDANISLHRPGEPLGTRTEVKNLNSLRSLVKAIDFEIERQISILECGGSVINETRSFDIETRETVSMRDKEVIQDYRFMPEPNLLPLRLYDSSELGCDMQGSLDIYEIRSSVPELPEAVRQRLMREYKLSLETAIMFVNDDDLLAYFLAVMSNRAHNPQIVTNLLLNNLLGVLNSKDVHIRNRQPCVPTLAACIQEPTTLNTLHMFGGSTQTAI